MTRDRWAEVERLYHLAVEQPPDRRAAFLDAQGVDEELRREVVSLLDHDADDDPVLDRPAIGLAARVLSDDRGPAASSLAPGQVIGHYRLRRLIGRGGMGDVFLADDLTLHRQVALKFLPADLDRDARAGERLLREARAASTLNHPNLVTVHAVEDVDAVRFIAMEYVEGETLRDRLGGGPAPLEEVLSIGVQVAGALSAAHGAGLVHRDIKPANIALTRSRQVKVLDFGIARRWDGAKTRATPAESQAVEPSADATATGTVHGTVSYMSPEQVRGDALDPRTDVFSLGATLYEAATGRRPFLGTDTAEILTSIATGDPPPPSSVRRGLPVGLDRVLGKALAKRPDDRFESADAFAAALASVADAPARRRRRWVAAIAGLALLAAAAVAAVRDFDARNLNWATARVAEAERLASQRQYREAFRLVLAAEPYVAGDPRLERVRLLAGDQLSVITEPPGARVSAIALADSDAAVPNVHVVGTTPIERAWLPRDDYLLRIEKVGFAPFARTISSTHARIDRAVFDAAPIARQVGFVEAPGGTPHLYLDAPAPITVNVRLIPASRAVAGMVFVRGGRYQLRAPGRPVTTTAELDDYYIDRYEVSNRDYRAFIDAGGYEKPDFWTTPVISGGRHLSWSEAMALFRDRTGKAGPRSWSDQRFPPGRDDYPVTDITWYEAAAFAAFRGRELPSLFQWEKAARDGQVSRVLGYVMPWGLHNPDEPMRLRANFQTDGPVPVGRFPFGISPYSTYQMAGNVAEWCVNARSPGYTVAGGSWQDPLYLFGQYGSYPGLYAGDTIGFRTVMLAGQRTTDQGAMPIVDGRSPAQPARIDERTYRTLSGYYRYDSTPLEPRIDARSDGSSWTRERVSFIGAHGARASAYLYLPKTASRPFQVVHYVPSDAVRFGLRLPDEIEALLTPLIRGGRALFSVVTEGTTERPYPGSYQQPARESVKYRDEIVTRAIDLQRGLDYLATRPEVDMSRLVGFGASIWSNELIGFGIEQRYRGVVLLASGVPSFESRALPEANAMHFVPRIRTPVLMINGRYDESMSWDGEVEPLFRLLPEPKRLQAFDGGHMPPLKEWIPLVTGWLDATLGPLAAGHSSSTREGQK